MTDQPKPLPVTWSHTGFIVSDMDRSLEFYRSVLGFEDIFDIRLPSEELADIVESEAPRMVGGLVGGGRVELVQFPGMAAEPPPQTFAPGFLNVSLAVDDIDAVYAEVQDRGIDHDGPPFDVSGHRILVLRDPDGLPFQLLQYPPGEGP